jgi:hypothetical protein
MEAAPGSGQAEGYDERGEGCERRMLATISEELGPPVSFGGVELEGPALLGKRPSAPLGRNDRAVRGDPYCWCAHTRACEGDSGGMRALQLPRREQQRPSLSAISVGLVLGMLRCCLGLSQRARCPSPAVKWCCSWLQPAATVVG